MSWVQLQVKYFDVSEFVLEHSFVGNNYKVVVFVIGDPLYPPPLPVYIVHLITTVHKFGDGKLLKDAIPALLVAYNSQLLALTKIS